MKLLLVAFEANIATSLVSKDNYFVEIASHLFQDEVELQLSDVLIALDEY